MKPALREILVDPVELRPLQLDISETAGDDVLAGRLLSGRGDEYPIRRGIPRFVQTEDAGQQQTADAFGFKWKKRETYDAPHLVAEHAVWCAEKYGYPSVDAWTQHFASRRCILDLGCGGGYSASAMLNPRDWRGGGLWVGVDISEAIDVARDRLSHLPNTTFVQADALALPFRDGTFDTVFSEGVLHHTPSTQAAINSGARVLAPGGEFHFYVYRRKGPVREFTDDYIRDAISGLSDEEAWGAMRSLTHLAQRLADLQAELTLDHDVPLLGIKAGRHDVQRLIYWNFAKLYWNPTHSFEENVHVNFDWYRPRYAHRQTAEQVREWTEQAGLRIEWFHEQESGYSVRAIRA